MSILFIAVSTVSAATVVQLTQTGCQFVEPEAVDHQYVSSQADDCKAINATTGAERLDQSRVLRLKAGDYLFRVRNKNVPYALGFWLRGAGLSRLSLPSVSGGGIMTGQSRDYLIHLDAGEYYYSCPLNPTPDYRLRVEK